MCHFPGFTAPTPVKFFVCSSSALRVSKTRCIVEQPAVLCFSPRCELCSTNRPLRYQLDLDSKHALQSSWTILLEVSSLCAWCALAMPVNGLCQCSSPFALPHWVKEQPTPSCWHFFVPVRPFVSELGRKVWCLKK